MCKLKMLDEIHYFFYSKIFMGAENNLATAKFHRVFFLTKFIL